MQEYLREQPERLAARPSVHVWLEQVRERKRSAPRRVAGRTILTQRDLGRLAIELLPFEPFAERAWALRRDVTSYDAWYVAIAEAFELPLATLARQTSLLDAFRSADDALLQAVRGISDLVTVHGLINLDFADVRTIMSEMGMAIRGCGVDDGGEPHIQACENDATVPDAPAEFTIDPLNDDDAEHDYESPAFPRRAK